MSIKKQKPLGRGAGVLLPVSSLPSPYGIGTLGDSALDFVEFLSAAGQKYWQVLPIGPTSYGDSPYQSFSAFAGNPYFIDFDVLCAEGLLDREDLAKISFGDNPLEVDYGKMYSARFKILQAAFANSDHYSEPPYISFCKDNIAWLDNYCLFMAIKNSLGGISWLEWPDDIRRREDAAVKHYTKTLEQDINFWKFCQYIFFDQWYDVKEYANGHNIGIIGDIPIYVAMDSADVWENATLFQLDADKFPLKVAGVPPDVFSATGQLWGNPLYDWNAMAKDDFAWWKGRMAFSARLYDIIRIDHFIGIVHYYSIPAQDKTATNGVWVDGPAGALIQAISSVMGDKKIIAEDLGVVTKQVKKLIKQSGYPGMKVLQFAFDCGACNENLPIHYQSNMIVYTGTHDNETLAGFFAHCPPKQIRYAKDYLGVRRSKDIPAAAIKAAHASVADTVVVQMQDYLMLGNDSRINTPSTLGGNWLWRLEQNQLTNQLASEMLALVTIYGR